jgi:5-methyltetrahydrofolate--homocysteine methyltransferase
LHMMDKIAGGVVANVVEEQRTRAKRRKELRANAVKPSIPDAANVPQVSQENPVPCPPFWGRRVVKEHLSPRLIFPVHQYQCPVHGSVGLKKGALTEEQYDRLIEEKALPVFNDLPEGRRWSRGSFSPKVVYGLLPGAESTGTDLIVYHVGGVPAGESVACGIDHAKKIVPHGSPRERVRFKFPRQEGRRRLVHSISSGRPESGEYDVLGVQLVTVGDKATEIAEKAAGGERVPEVSLPARASASSRPRRWPSTGTSTCGRRWASRARTTEREAVVPAEVSRLAVQLRVSGVSEPRGPRDGD